MKKYLLLFAVFGPASVTFAQGTSTGLSSLKIPAHAYSAAMGASSVASTNSLSAAELNPASAIYGDERLEVLFTHTAWIQGTDANRLSVSLPTPAGRFFLTTGMFSVPDIEIRTQPGPASSTFSARTAILGAGWGTRVMDGILFGLSASYLYDRLYDVEATGLAASAGLTASDIIPGMSLGASVSNLGSVSGYKGTTSDLPTRFTIGGAYSLPFGELTVAPQVAYQSVRDGASGFHVGASISYAFLSVRGSFRTGETAQSGSFGASITYSGISVEYALVPFTYGLGNGQLISIGIDL